jgi:4-hydroxy 2-oxovalerate aldolase
MACPSRVKICDCTIRDGGLVNDSQFSPKMVRRIYQALSSAGVDIIELGYKNSKKMVDPKRYGSWRFCDEDLLSGVVKGIDTSAKLAVMQDAHKADAADLLPKADSVIDIVRIATYVKDIEKAIWLENSASYKGYQTTINIMAISHESDSEIKKILRRISEETNVIACYIVDSFGSFYPGDIDHYFELFKANLDGIEIGVHCHNQQQLAFANTLRSADNGVTYLDGTLYGLGRAAGNCPMELLAGALKDSHLDMKPLIDVIGKEILPLQKKIHWGYAISHALTGILNLHPKPAIEHMELPEDSIEKYEFIGLFDQLMQTAPLKSSYVFDYNLIKNPEMNPAPQTDSHIDMQLKPSGT